MTFGALIPSLFENGANFTADDVESGGRSRYTRSLLPDFLAWCGEIAL